MRVAAATDLADTGELPVVDALGTPVALRVEPAFVARLRSQWARCLTSAAPVHVLDLRGHTDTDVREYVAAWQVTMLGLARLVDPAPGDCSMKPRVNLHAAGLADASGSVLALVGASGSGKTTAAAALGQQLGYVTDECVSVDSGNLRVLRYPKPLSVVAPGKPGAKTQRAPDELALRVPPTDLRLAAVVFLRRSPVATTPSLTELPLGEALMELVPQVSGVARMATPLRELAGLVGRTGGALRLDYRDILDAEPLLRELVSRRREAEGWGQDVRHLRPQAPGPEAPGQRGLRRRPWADAIDTQHQLVVFDRRRPFLIEGLSRDVWHLIGPHHPSSAAVHQQVTDLHGAHADSRELVSRAIASLADAGLVDVVDGSGR